MARTDGVPDHLPKEQEQQHVIGALRVSATASASCLLWHTRHGRKRAHSRIEEDALASAGPVLLLTNPRSAGYVQNPISVYYCYSCKHELVCCIAEVTNTPWGERVTFVFSPAGTRVPKSLHVSPMMDMKNTWCEFASDRAQSA